MRARSSRHWAIGHPEGDAHGAPNIPGDAEPPLIPRSAATRRSSVELQAVEIELRAFIWRMGDRAGTSAHWSRVDPLDRHRSPAQCDRCVRSRRAPLIRTQYRLADDVTPCILERRNVECSTPERSVLAAEGGEHRAAKRGQSVLIDRQAEPFSQGSRLSGKVVLVEGDLR